MLRIFDNIIGLVRTLTPVFEAVGRRDGELASQGRRALQSCALNTAEGSGVRGGNRRVHYERAHGSALETYAALRVAEASGYIEAMDPEVMRELDRVKATLYRVSRR